MFAVQESLPEEYDSQPSEAEPEPAAKSLLPAPSPVQNASVLEGLTVLLRVAEAPQESLATRVTSKGEEVETEPRAWEYSFFMEENLGYL